MVNSTILAYKLGEIAADFLLIGVGGETAFKLYAGFNSFKKFATLHKIASNDPEKIIENLFECLPYLE